MYLREIFFCCFFFLGIWEPVNAQADSKKEAVSEVYAQLSASSIRRTPTYRGWDFLVSRLRAEGYSEQSIRRIYQNAKMPQFTDVFFALAPAESPRIYDSFYRPQRISLGKQFLADHVNLLARAETEFGVSRHVVAAILLIETQFGRVTGNNLIVNRLSRVASVREPQNLLVNYRRHKEADPKVAMQDVLDRSLYLEETFFPEVKALFYMMENHGVDVFDLKGSSAGAFGIPQFLPSSFLRFAVTADRQSQRASLFSAGDAILSTANYLSQHGWKNDGSLESRRKAIWHYNRSEAYVDAVLKVAELLKS
jgi:membrane-bound lytic murein transglycosylase B